ncbi:MAG: flagellar hook-basal body complex protein, partial [Clostridiales bacterium]|nr:flagellar hook-basal body complex protein [Clostridiales bacterium]
MDVIGNNISNVNTIGFKSSSVNFSDVFYQTTQSASGPNAATGTTGRNAMQIGLGSNVAAITTSVGTTGASQRTDNPFDVMIEGDGFFIVNYGGSNYFTKAGSFGVDAYGTLCTPAGASVMGWQVDDNDPTKTVADVVSPLNIMSPQNMYANPEATTAVYISGNIDSKDTQIASNATGKMVNLSFFDNMGHSYKADFRVRQTSTSTNNYSVDVLDVKDETGKSIFVEEEVDATTGNVTYKASSITTVRLGTAEFKAEVDPATGKVTMNTGDVQLSFNGSTGAFVGIGNGTSVDSAGNSITFAITADAGGSNPFRPIDVDFSKVTMYSNSGNSTLEANKGSLDGIGAGKKVGNLTGISIDGSGKIYGRYDNGDSRLLGQIAVATFANPAGLESIGNSMFAATQNSGDFDGIGQDPTQGGGSLTTGVLEMSNVDLSSQFTDMITTQRGFQANSRIITTSDTLLEELINLKR